MYDYLGGLEVKLPNSDKWSRVGHLGGSIFINAGELLSVWTNGSYPALVSVKIIYLVLFVAQHCMTKVNN